ncbi:hypothetical protein HDU96_004621 [Phlyctochytrium bullatum]|nr:hypothetical protein HDU96_004621 [Phlyctochytrium bullatum]
MATKTPSDEDVVNDLTEKIKHAKPPNPSLFTERALVYERMGLWDLALADLRTANTLRPTAAPSPAAVSGGGPAAAAAEGGATTPTPEAPTNSVTPEEAGGDETNLDDRIRDLIRRNAEAKAKAEAKETLAGLVGLVCGEGGEGGDGERMEGVKRLAGLTKETGVARRVVVDGYAKKLVAAFVELRTAKKGAGEKTAKKDGLEGLDLVLVAILIHLAAVKESVPTLLAELTREEVTPLFFDETRVDLTVLSLELSSTLVRTQPSPELEAAYVKTTERFLGAKVDAKLVGAAVNGLIKAVVEARLAEEVVLGSNDVLPLLLRLTVRPEGNLKSLCPVMLAHAMDLVPAAKEDRVQHRLAGLIHRWLAGDAGDKALGLLALSSVFTVRNTMGAKLLQSDGVMDEILDTLEYEPDAIHTAALEVFSSACLSNECRKLVAARCVPFLSKMARSENDGRRTTALSVLAKLMANEKDLEGGVLGARSVAQLVTVVKDTNAKSETRVSALEGLAYMSLQPEVKGTLIKDPAFLKALVDLSKTDDRSQQYGIATVVGHLSLYRKPLTKEEEQLLKLKEMSGEKVDKDHPLDDDPEVEARGRVLVSAGIVPALARMAPGAGANLSQALSQVLVNLATDKKNRGRMVQEGGIKVLLQLASSANNTDPGKLLAAQALAKIAITTDPHIAFKSGGAAELVRPLVSLCNSDKELYQFEGLMALTNLASLDDAMRSRIVQMKGVKAMEFLQFSDNPLVRRAATEALCNMIFDETVFASYVTGPASGKLRLMVALCDSEDYETRRAAFGAIAILSASPDACRLLIDESKGLDVVGDALKTVTRDGGDEEENPEILHRAVECAKNMAAAGAGYCLKIEAAGLVRPLRELVKHPMKEICLSVLETLKHMQSAGASVTVGRSK